MSRNNSMDDWFVFLIRWSQITWMYKPNPWRSWSEPEDYIYRDQYLIPWIINNQQLPSIAFEAAATFNQFHKLSLIQESVWGSPFCVRYSDLSDCVFKYEGGCSTVSVRPVFTPTALYLNNYIFIWPLNILRQYLYVLGTVSIFYLVYLLLLINSSIVNDN
jgi:hypothetical protein